MRILYIPLQAKNKYKAILKTKRGLTLIINIVIKSKNNINIKLIPCFRIESGVTDPPNPGY